MYFFTAVIDEFAWIMARERELSEGKINLLKLYLQVNGVDTTKMTDVDQTECDPYDLE